MLTRIITCIATFFYSGYLPKAPGTWGTLATIPVILLLRNETSYVAAIMVFFFIGRYAADFVARKTGVEDPKEVVIDEVVGMMLALVFLPKTVLTIVLGFVLFRLFDITKPWIIKKVEAAPNGYGIMYDDMIAGVFANILVRIILMIVG